MPMEQGYSNILRSKKPLNIPMGITNCWFGMKIDENNSNPAQGTVGGIGFDFTLER